MDPLRVPTEFPVVSIRNLLDFVRGKHAWDVEIFESALTVVAYGYGMAALPKAIGAALPDPAPVNTVVIEGLQAAQYGLDLTNALRTAGHLDERGVPQ